MENADVLGSSTAPLTLHDFFERMRHPSATDFVKAIRNFVASFSNNAPNPERDSAAVQDFLTQMEAAFRAHPLWAGCSEEELESAGEGLEKYVMTKLFTRVFASLPDDVKFDDQLYEKMALIQQFIRPENLDIKPTFQNETSWLTNYEFYTQSIGLIRALQEANDTSAVRDKGTEMEEVITCLLDTHPSFLRDPIALKVQSYAAGILTYPPFSYGGLISAPLLPFWQLAQKELQKINMYKAPRDKLACILNCCKVINNLLFHASIASNENPPGADEFLPVLIFVTLKANPPQLHSNLLYIQRYRGQTRLVAEAAYFFTNMLSAESFISNIDANALSMDETEFEDNMESARALLSSLSGDTNFPSNPSDQNIGHVPRAEPKQRSLDSKKEKDPTIQPQLSMAKIPSISDLEDKGASTLLKEDQVSTVFQEYPYLFAHVGDLTVNDVDDLLNNYKQLVFKYVCLSKGLAVSTPSHPLSTSQTQAQSHAETVKESEDNSRAEDMNDNETQKEDVGRSNDGLSAVFLSEVENLESKLSKDEAVLPQRGGNDEISQ